MNTHMLGRVLLAVGLLLAALPAPVAAANDTVAGFRVIASPFTSDAVSTRNAAGIRLRLIRRARVSLTIETQAGTVISHLANGARRAAGGYGWEWTGQDDIGQQVPDGDYVAHIVVVNGLGTDSRTQPVRKGMPPIYPANPGAITVLINPGHGAGSIGAARKGVVEKAVNLDIGLRLRRLLEAAGVHVVMTRTTDTYVNWPRTDVNGDGIIGQPPGEEDWDQLAARIDIANQARADVHIFNHNNGSRDPNARGTKTFVGMRRNWTPEGVVFATFVQSAQVAQLDTFRSSTYYPINRGVRPGRYYTLSPFDPIGPPLLPRPTQMPTLLTESLYISNPVERELLRREDVREALAIAFYMGIAEYLATRDYGVRYELVGAPTAVAAGGAADYQVKVTNTGNLTSAGWQLQLHSVVAVPFYDGSEAIGDPMGAVAIPDGLGPGQSTTLTVHATAPSAAGAWLVKADVWTTEVDRPYLSQRGVVALQVPLTTQ